MGTGANRNTLVARSAAGFFASNRGIQLGAPDAAYFRYSLTLAPLNPGRAVLEYALARGSSRGLTRLDALSVFGKVATP